MQLRDYQQRALDQLYEWFRDNEEGNPCLVLPTGSGKSHIVAVLCKDAVQNWPETRILMLTHVKELIQQNAEKMRLHWPNAPLGIYSAGIGKREFGMPITFAGIQSVRDRADLIGHVDLILIDECFAGETKISTPSGDKRIDEVRCGDVVFNQCGVGKVEAISTRIVNEIYEVALNDGSKIRCTGNHQFFTERGWIKASALENGSHLFSVEDMSSLWGHIQAMDKDGKRKGEICNAGRRMEHAKFLLGEVCKEIHTYSIERTSKAKNQQTSKGNKTHAYNSWRERAIAAFAAAGTSSRARRWMGSRTVCPNKDGTQKRHLSKSLQNRHSQQKEDDCNRIGWGEPLQFKEKITGQKERPTSCGIRVESVSHIECKSHKTVFNIQVSGHPSYFAGGVAVHNCHLVSHKDEGGYRTLINALRSINPKLRVVGLTATPWRLGHGEITEGDALFDALLDPVTIEELVYKGYLAPLHSKLTKAMLSVDGVHKRGGEFIESELQAAVDKDDLNAAVVDEIIALAGERRSWLLFCTGVDHSHHIRDALRLRGISAETIIGTTPKGEREKIITDYKAGKIQAITNANVLTTGFDHPDIDLIAMLRPTMSPVLYMQMAGRGLRPKSHTDHCLVLDFAGVVQTHGPITNVNSPNKKGEGGGDAPVKICDNCAELVHPTIRVCPACGFEFPAPEMPKLELRDDDIMGNDPLEFIVENWHWDEYTSKAGNKMVRVTYRKWLGDRISEYFVVLHDNPHVRSRAARDLFEIADKAGVPEVKTAESLAAIVDFMNAWGHKPSVIKYKMDGKFERVIGREWALADETSPEQFVDEKIPF